MKKHLYACGCSFTASGWRLRIDGQRTDIGDWPKWPERLASALGLEHVNEGMSGCGNDFILDYSTRYILENHKDIEIVCILWTEAERFSLLDQSYIHLQNYLSVHRSVKEDIMLEHPYETVQYMYQYLNRNHSLGFVLGRRFTKQVYTVQKLCQELNLKYIFAQALGPFYFREIQDRAEHLKLDNFNAMRELKNFTKAKYFHKIDRDHFIGWPGQRELGGYTVQDKPPYNHKLHDVGPTYCPDIAKDPNDPILGDPHPNAIGHQLIADLYLNKYKQLYG